MKRFTLFLSLCLVCLGTALGQTVVSTLEGLSNDKVYNILSARGTGKALLYHATSAPNNLASNYGSGHTDIAYSTTEPAYQFAIYKSDGGHYYIYSIAGSKFVGSVTGNNSAIPMTDALTNDIEIRTTGTATAKVNASDASATTYPFLLSTNRSGAVNLAETAGCHGVVNWNGGYTVNNDGGNCFLFLEVGNIDADVKSSIATKVTSFETQVNVTYVYSIDGTSTTKSVVVSQQANSASAAPAQDYLTIVSYSPANVGTSDCTVNVACTENLPFQKTTDLGAPNWYAMKMHSNQQKLVSWSTESSKMAYNAGFNASDYGVVSSDANFWCVTGNVMDGFKLYNKEVGTGSALTYASGDPAMSATDESNTWTLVKSTANAAWYCFQKPGGGNCYMNLDLTAGKVTYWSAADAGSSCMFLTPASFPVNYAGGYIEVPVGAVGGSKYVNANYSALQTLLSEVEAAPFDFTKAGQLVTECASIAAGGFVDMASGYYYVLSAQPGLYANNKGLIYEKASGKVRWNTVNRNDINSILKFTTDADESAKYNIYACNAEGYIQGIADENEGNVAATVGTGSKVTLTSLGNAQYNFFFSDTESAMHANGHGNGAGASGNIIDWNGGLSSASAWYIVPATEIEVAMNEVGGAYYATAYLPFGVTVSGATAYAVEATASRQATATAVAAVPAKYGVVLKGESATATLTINDAATPSPANDLSGVLVATAKTEGDLVLGNNGGIGFYTFNGTDLAANKAYLPASAVPSGGGAAGMQLVFGGVTSIEGLQSESSASAPLFDLSGRRVVKAQKGGIYIQNGRKFIVK